MSTFLELCADLATDSGIFGSAPSSVTAQTGRHAKCVYWVKEAWRQMQNELPDANFLQGEFQGNLIAGTARYAATSLGITDYARWLGDIMLHKSGEKEQEGRLTKISYDLWRDRYDFRTHDQNRPVSWAVAPNEELCVGPTPDAAYIIRGRYQRTPQVLANNADVPLLPARFHSAIVYRAEMLANASDEAWDAYKASSAKYAPILLDIQRDCLPAITTGGNSLGR